MNGGLGSASISRLINVTPFRFLVDLGGVVKRHLRLKKPPCNTALQGIGFGGYRVLNLGIDCYG